MAKQESTAINDLIHLVQGRIIDDSEGAQDNLFVTASAPRMPAPLPRRRAPNATPPLVPVTDYDDDEDAATAVDPHALGAEPHWAIGSAPNPRPSAPVVAPWPQPILPRYALPTPAPVLPTPAPLPPAPYHAAADATERVEQYDELPPAVWTSRPALPARPFEAHLDTVRVPALPPPPDVAVEEPVPSELVTMIKRCALPFTGLAIAMMFVGGFIVHSGQGGHKREVPVVMAVTPAPAPVVTPIDPPPAAWKPTAVQPTIAPAAEVAAPAPAPVAVAAPAAVVEEPAVEPEPEIEMEPATVTRPRKHRAKKVAAPVRVVARAARPEPKPVVARGRKADPVAVALAEPTRSAKPATKGTGPGTVTITSTPSALIYVDGRSTNQMTPKTLTLAPGVHKITLLEVSSRKAKTAEVDLAAGGAAQIAKKF